MLNNIINSFIFNIGVMRLLLGGKIPKTDTFSINLDFTLPGFCFARGRIMSTSRKMPLNLMNTLIKGVLPISRPPKISRLVIIFNPINVINLLFVSRIRDKGLSNQSMNPKRLSTIRSLNSDSFVPSRRCTSAVPPSYTPTVGHRQWVSMFDKPVLPYKQELTNLTNQKPCFWATTVNQHIISRLLSKMLKCTGGWINRFSDSNLVLPQYNPIQGELQWL